MARGIQPLPKPKPLVTLRQTSWKKRDNGWHMFRLRLSSPPYHHWLTRLIRNETSD